MRQSPRGRRIFPCCLADGGWVKRVGLRGTFGMDEVQVGAARTGGHAGAARTGHGRPMAGTAGTAACKRLRWSPGQGTIEQP